VTIRSMNTVSEARPMASRMTALSICGMAVAGSIQLMRLL